MSYCRFTEADVYVFHAVNDTLVCCCCSLQPVKKGHLLPKDFFTESRTEMLFHLREHEDKGDYIPDHVFEDIEYERITLGDKVGVAE